jgi:hypothetical protein
MAAAKKEEKKVIKTALVAAHNKPNAIYLDFRYLCYGMKKPI